MQLNRLHLLEAQRGLLGSRREHVKSLLELHPALANLERDMGGILEPHACPFGHRYELVAPECCNATLDFLWETQILGFRCGQSAVLAEVLGTPDEVFVLVQVSFLQADVSEKAEMLLVPRMRHGDCGF